VCNCSFVWLRFSFILYVYVCMYVCIYSWKFYILTLVLLMGRGKIPYSTFVTITLELPKVKQCTFVTFPKYGMATKCYAHRWYTTCQKSNMAAQKPEICKPSVAICGSHYISSSRACSNKILSAVRIFSVSPSVMTLSSTQPEVALYRLYLISAIMRLPAVLATTSLNQATLKVWL